jgi:hypothetical protein
VAEQAGRARGSAPLRIPPAPEPLYHRHCSGGGGKTAAGRVYNTNEHNKDHIAPVAHFWPSTPTIGPACFGPSALFRLKSKTLNKLTASSRRMIYDGGGL